MKKLSIVVPCYNEQETIYPFLEATQKVEQQMKDQLIFDYIFVNDGSKDDTLTILRDVAKRFDNVHYLSFSRNFGKEAGLLAGLEAADGDLVTVMDADLQDPP
ncbi:glycosyltransferase, partial [Streptococcus alactolyticus]